MTYPLKNQWFHDWTFGDLALPIHQFKNKISMVTQKKWLYEVERVTLMFNDFVGWLWNQFLQLCLLTDPPIWNVTSSENISWSITPDTLVGPWKKLDYHMDVCRLITNGANIEVYQTNKNLRTYPLTIYNHVSKKFHLFWFAE